MASLEKMKALAEGYSRIADSALEMALDAQVRIKAMEATTHRVQYVPTSVAEELKSMVDKADGDDQKLTEQLKSYKGFGEFEKALDELGIDSPPDL